MRLDRLADVTVDGCQPARYASTSLAFLEAGACTHEDDEVSCGQGTPAGLGGVEEFERHCDLRKVSLESRSARQVCLSLIDGARIRWVCPGWRDQVVR